MLRAPEAGPGGSVTEAGPTKSGPTASASWRSLGCDIRLVVTDPAALPEARELLAADLAALDLAASRFRTDSEVAALHAAGGRRMPISPVLADCIAAALMAAELSGGDLDPTMGSELVELGYDRTFAELPASHEPASATSHRPALSVRQGPKWSDVELDMDNLTVRVPAGVLLDLGATAKARCADIAAARIAAACGCGVLVSLGGDIAMAGQAPVGGWVVQVQDATGDPAQSVPGSCRVALESGGLATSSTTARRWRRGGSVLHHILDPRTGQPAGGPWRTVTVAAPSALLANIASTTSIIRGRAARNWITELGLPARLVAADPTSPDVLLGGWPHEEDSCTA